MPGHDTTTFGFETNVPIEVGKSIPIIFGARRRRCRGSTFPLSASGGRRLGSIIGVTGSASIKNADSLLQFFASKYSMHEIQTLPDGITVSREITVGNLLTKHGTLTEVHIKSEEGVPLEPVELTCTFSGSPKTVLFNVLLFFIFGLTGWGLTQE